MKILTTNKVEQTELVDQLDFTEEVKTWLLEKGYTRKVSQYGLKKVSYEKGALSIEPEKLFGNCVATVFLSTHTRVTSDKKSLNIVEGNLEYRDMESCFLKIENELADAQEDFKDFYNRWLDYAGEEE